MGSRHHPVRCQAGVSPPHCHCQARGLLAHLWGSVGCLLDHEGELGSGHQLVLSSPSGTVILTATSMAAQSAANSGVLASLVSVWAGVAQTQHLQAIRPDPIADLAEKLTD